MERSVTSFKSVGEALVTLARPKQWTKNILVFGGAVFAAKLNDPAVLVKVWAAFFAMALVSSATYCFNDVIDAEKDRSHPKKKFRPIASGAVSPQRALSFGTSLLVAGLVLSFFVSPWVLLWVCAYLLIQIAYNLWLKKIEVADVATIATGFILRAVIGAQAVPTPVSGWLLFCTGALALMLGFAKRREEFISQGDDRGTTRGSLLGYNQQALDMFVTLFGGVAIMCYGIYCLDSRTGRQIPGLLFTAPFVTYGVMRYLFIVFSRDEGGEPADILLKDRHIIFSVLGFFIAAMVALAGKPIPLIER